jgi:hypothetical protein
LSAAPPDIFISYAHQDVEWVRPLAAELERRAWCAFWDLRTPAAKLWRTYIGAQLYTSRCVIVVWSEHALQSKFVLEEGAVGRDRDVLLPIVRQRVRPPLGFGEIHAANLVEWRPGEPSSEFETFVADLGEMLGRTLPTLTAAEVQPPGPPAPIKQSPEAPAIPAPQPSNAVHPDAKADIHTSSPSTTSSASQPSDGLVTPAGPSWRASAKPGVLLGA